MKAPYSNVELVTLAVYLLGGSAQHVDLEDIAVKASELAPGRFSWVKYPEQINLRAVQKRLYDAVNEEKAGYLVGSDKQGWMLTERGVGFSEHALMRLDPSLLTRQPAGQLQLRRFRVERQRMLASDAYAKFRSACAETIDIEEAQAFFRIDDYVSWPARERKVLRTLNLFGSDPELGELVHFLATKVREHR